jgi:hypothetical protein
MNSWFAGSVTALTKERIAVLVSPSFQEGRGSASAAAREGSPVQELSIRKNMKAKQGR